MKILRQLREDKGITQAELGKILSISPSTIGMYEQGRRSPDYDTLNKIADYFGVSTDKLLGRDSLQRGLLGDGFANQPQNTQVIEETPKHRVLVDASQGLSDEEMDVLIDMANILRAKHNID